MKSLRTRDHPVHKHPQFRVLVHSGVVLHHLSISQQRSHGRSQFVCGDLDEIRFRVTESLQLSECAIQLLVGLAQLRNGLLVCVPQALRLFDQDSDAQRRATPQHSQKRPLGDLKGSGRLGCADRCSAYVLLQDRYLAENLACSQETQVTLGFVGQLLDYLRLPLNDSVDSLTWLSFLVQMIAPTGNERTTAAWASSSKSSSARPNRRGRRNSLMSG